MMTAGQGEQVAAVPSSSLKVDIVVHGRFHGFALGRALMRLGHDVLVHTNYPTYVVARFGVPRVNTRSFVCHALLARSANRIEHRLPKDALDRILHTMFGRWAARGLRRDADVVYGFSGVMEEVLGLPRDKPSQLRLVCRGSAHIAEQDRILAEEEKRVGARLDRPSRWMIEREEREYALADMVSVLSSFASASFLARGLPPDRLNKMPLGVNVAQFQASVDVVDQRRRRLLAGEPLRVLNVGTFSFQKGTRDLIDIAAALSDRMRFRFVGTRPKETAHLTRDAANIIEFIDRVPESALAEQYAWADVFVFTTLQDGFAAVLLQASVSGLPVLSTANCAAPDFIDEGRTGFILPIRDTAGFIDRLRALDENRPALAGLADAAAQGDYTRDWSQMAQELVALTRRAAQRRRT